MVLMTAAQHAAGRTDSPAENRWSPPADDPTTTAAWPLRVTVRGAIVVIRPLTPTDQQLLVDALEHLSPLSPGVLRADIDLRPLAAATDPLSNEHRQPLGNRSF